MVAISDPNLKDGAIDNFFVNIHELIRLNYYPNIKGLLKLFYILNKIEQLSPGLDWQT